MRSLESDEFDEGIFNGSYSAASFKVSEHKNWVRDEIREQQTSN